MQTFLVGGAVRDKLLGHPVKDRDWVVVGSTPQEMLDLGFTQVGVDFPVFLHPDSNEEHALARQERKVAPGYHGFETHFEPDVTLEDDLRRRDLTVNAMAMDEDGNLIDPFNGQQDLKDGVLRHVSDAFGEDPVRVLRIARFAARYNFTVHPSTMKLMENMVEYGELDHLTPERVWAEFEKAMGESHPNNFLWVLEKTGAMNKLFPELSRAVIFVGRAINQLSLLNQSVISKIMTLFMEINEDDAMAVLERMKAPSNVKQLTLKYNRFMKAMINDKANAANFMCLMKELDLFRHPDHLHTMAITSTLTRDYGNVLTFVEAFREAEKVTFRSLSDEQQTTLKNQEIGHAIDNLRMEVIAKVARFR